MGNGTSKAINNHVQNAQKTGVCQLTEMDIKEVPEKLFLLKQNLRVLDLSTNQIEIVPDAIGGFIQMKSLCMDKNLLTSLPKSIGKLKKLESLSVSYNMIKSIPSTINGLKNLVTVNLSCNKLIVYPNELNHLKKLDAIDLQDNSIKVIPDDIKSCSAIEINLNKNKLSKIPEALAECPRLKVFRFEENHVDKFSSNILINSKICLIKFDGNMFSAKQFQNLDGHDKYMERYTATKRKFD